MYIFYLIYLLFFYYIIKLFEFIGFYQSQWPNSHIFLVFLKNPYYFLSIFFNIKKNLIQPAT